MLVTKLLDNPSNAKLLLMPVMGQTFVAPSTARPIVTPVIGRTFTAPSITKQVVTPVIGRAVAAPSTAKPVVTPVKDQTKTAPSTKEKKYQNPFNYDYFETMEADISETIRVQKVHEAVRAKKNESKRVKLYRCKLCKKQFPPEDVLQHFEFHKKIADQSSDVTNEADVVFRCPVCLNEFYSRSCYERHVQKHHQTKDFACETCNESFLMEYQLGVHMAQHTKNPSLFTCFRCRNFSTMNQSHLMMHFNNVHYTDTSWQFYCEQCERYFVSKGLFDSHKIFHVENNSKLFCDLCKTFLQDSLDYKSHMTSVHNIKSTKGFKCEKCDLTFPAYKNYQRHEQKVHRPRVPLLCTVCGKAFERKQNLAEHMKIHGEGKYVCQVCGKKFKKPQGLSVHTLTHTGQKPHKCNVCQKSFSQRSTLVIHMRTHTGEKPYPCDMCKKGFITKTVRDAHRKSCRF